MMISKGFALLRGRFVLAEIVSQTRLKHTRYKTRVLVFFGADLKLTPFGKTRSKLTLISYCVCVKSQLKL